MKLWKKRLNKKTKKQKHPKLKELKPKAKPKKPPRSAKVVKLVASLDCDKRRYQRTASRNKTNNQTEKFTWA